MRNNLEHALSRGMHQQGSSYGHMTYVLTGDLIVPADGPMLLFLDPGGADRTVYLPALRQSGGQQIWIFNITTASYVLNVVDADGVAVVAVESELVTVCSANHSTWRPFALTNPASITDVTTTPYTVLYGDTYIRSNIASNSVITLPLAATRDGRAVRIIDASYQIGTLGYTITINRAGSELINGQTSLEIVSDGGTFLLQPVTNGWDVLP